jgi:hypothetical protein
LTSARRVAANRRNARRSTGPRTASGKATAARNALRHGLSVAVFADPALAKDIAGLAERLAHGSGDLEMRELAVRVAAAQVDVGRVRDARNALFPRPPVGAPAAEARSDGMADKIRQLVALDRYERQAMWRRTLAIRAWEAALFRGIGGAP